MNQICDEKQNSDKEETIVIKERKMYAREKNCDGELKDKKNVVMKNFIVIKKNCIQRNMISFGGEEMA